MELNVETIRFNYIFAILGFVLDIICVLNIQTLSILLDLVALYGTITCLTGLLGLLGIWLFDKDYIVAAAQYLICGLAGIIIGVTTAGVVGFVLFLIASILAVVEKDKSKMNNKTTTSNVHYFNEENPTENTETTIKPGNNKKLWAIPIISIIILVAVHGAIGMTVNSGSSSSGDTIIASLGPSGVEISNFNIVSEGYSMYTVSCDLTPKKSYDYLEMDVKLYDESGAQINGNTLAWNSNDVAANQLIKASGSVFVDNQKSVPKRAEIFVYENAIDSSDSSNAIYSQNVTIN
ncbi:hypothetical protein [uncultured Methanosphaera sp.]|uniref:hypothetical protein n=1 Tax=uncultured Methanosphaera sp. TaxID=262501 RepID=UPI000DC42A76|nr:hypothetical protein [uncultured Methanosphaera sp.]RAP45236.1 MAG: hypothetical protein BZ134_01930 [Methanosphaera sp. SHI1033]